MCVCYFEFDCLQVYFSCEIPAFAIYFVRGSYIRIIRILYVCGCGVRGQLAVVFRNKSCFLWLDVTAVGGAVCVCVRV